MCLKENTCNGKMKNLTRITHLLLADLQASLRGNGKCRQFSMACGCLYTRGASEHFSILLCYALIKQGKRL